VASETFPIKDKKIIFILTAKGLYDFINIV